MIEVGKAYEYTKSKNGNFTFVVVATTDDFRNSPEDPGHHRGFTVLLLEGRFWNSGFNVMKHPGHTFDVGRNSNIALFSDAL